MAAKSHRPHPRSGLDDRFHALVVTLVQNFGSGGTYVQHSRKIRIKFLPKNFAPYVRKLPQGLWNVLVTRDAVPRAEVLPPELLQGELFVKERPLLEGYLSVDF
jgi:hypothetical protein